MKRFTFLTLVSCFSILMFSVNTPIAYAQDDCEALETWLEKAQLIMNEEYEDAIIIIPSVDAVANLQRLRRELEATERPSQADETHNAWIKTFSLSEEAIIAALVYNDPELVGEGIDSEGLWEQADQQRQIAEEKTVELIQFAETCSSVDTPAPAPTIMDPTDGAEVEWLTDVSGTYDPDQFREDELWIFIVSPGKMYYPQMIQACEPNRLPLAMEPAFGEWSIQVHIGEEQGNQGEEFRIVLMRGSADASQLMYDKFQDEWCPANQFEGLTSKEVRDMGFEGVTYIRVVRQ